MSLTVSRVNVTQTGSGRAKYFAFITGSPRTETLPFKVIDHRLLLWIRIFLENLVVVQLVKKYLAVHETEGSLPHSQEPATGPYHEQ
jgi:hypothetical protein